MSLLILPALFFIAVIVIGVLISVGLMFARRNMRYPQEKQERRDAPNIIDVQALDDDRPMQDSGDPLLKP